MSPRASFLRRHLGKIVLILILLIIAIPVALIVWAANQIANPPRRELAAYHREYFSDTANHGISIERFIATDGTPCLVCSPAKPIGKRGQILIEQLAAKDIDTSPDLIVGNLVLLHGRTGRKEDYLPVAERFCAIGFRCIIPDLPAHGDHPAKVATYGIREASIPRLVLDEAASKFGFSAEPSSLVGMSMGGSVAIHAAAQPDAPWKSLIILCSYDSFPAVIRENASHKVGAALSGTAANAIAVLYEKRTGVSLDSIQPHKLAANIRIPTLIAHGTDDRTIPIAAGRRLHQSFPPESKNAWIEIEGANHNNLLITPYPIYSEMAAWLLRHTKP